MAIVERPNQEALSRGIDIFRDDMRTFLFESLSRVPARNVEIAIRKGLQNGQVESFDRNLTSAKDLKSAIDVNFLVPLTNCYWDDVFKQRFRNKGKFLDKIKRIVEARNRASHPPYRSDLDREYTIGKLCLIATFLGTIGARDSQKAVANIRARLGESETYPGQNAAINDALEEESISDAAARDQAEQRAQVAEARSCQAVVDLNKEVAARKDAEELADQTAARLTKTESILESMNEKLKIEEFVRKGAEKRGEAAETEICHVTDKLEGEVAARKAAEELAERATARLKRIESDLDVTKWKLNEEESARKENEQRAKAADASISQLTNDLKREAAARREAEDRAKEEARGRQLAEQANLEERKAHRQTKKKLSTTDSISKRPQGHAGRMEKAVQESAALAKQVLSGKPFDLRTAQHELWLIDEILSGRLDRASLRQLAGDDRLSGRLVYFVQAASSEMNGAAWKGYVAGRQKALLRNGEHGAHLASQQRGNLDRAHQH